MMLVHRDHVEAEGFGRNQMVDLRLVLVGAFLGIVKLVGQNDPGGTMFVPFRHIREDDTASM